MKEKREPIPFLPLNARFYQAHKQSSTPTKFACDDTNELIDNQFGLYSSTGLKAEIKPTKSNFYRVAICRRGKFKVSIGLEEYTHQRGTIHFTTPGEIFSLSDKSPDMQCYYALFLSDFIAELSPPLVLEQKYPFFTLGGARFFQLSEDEFLTIERLFEQMSAEIDVKSLDYSRMLKLCLNQIFILAKRSFARQEIHYINTIDTNDGLVARFKRLVAQDFTVSRNLEDYASKLAVSKKTLSRVVKEKTGKTPAAFIKEMLLLEAKALLVYTELTISEIAYQLHFFDPSHFVRFFRKEMRITPLDFRAESRKM